MNKNIYKGIWRGCSLLRTLMNEECRKINLAEERVLDVGAGSKLADYHKFFSKPAAIIESTDIKNGQGNLSNTVLNLESDQLPFQDNSFDSVLAFNILEHIFNHQFLVNQMYRVTKKHGRLIGFVPFLINFHPDPQDYFRYTESALEKIFANAGYKNIVITRIGAGPMFVNFNNIVISLPRFLRMILLPIYTLLDAIIVKLRPKITRRYPLGYFFQATK